MTTSVDVFLSDEFAEFSQKMAELKQEKKAKQTEIQELVTKAKKELAEIDAKANAVIAEFESFQSKNRKE